MGATVDMFVRLAISMAAVMAVMGLAARLLRRRAGGGPGILGGVAKAQKSRPQAVEVLCRRSLTKGASVAVVQAAGKTLVLGVTEHSVSLLVDTSHEAARNAPEEQPLLLDSIDIPRTGGMPALKSADTAALPANAWKLTLDSLRERTVRR
jgi:flagellar biogenesis protein FliO